MLGRMADENLRAQTAQALGHGIGFEIGALHVVAEVQQHFRDAAHAAAANADQVNDVNTAHSIVQAMIHGMAHAGVPAAKQKSATCAAASMTRARRAASAIFSRRPRSAVSSAMQALKVSAVKSRSCSTRPAPMLTMASAFLV